MARTIVDALLAVDLVVVMATALVEEAPHEYAGIALVVLTIAHIVLNRRWFTTLSKGRWNAVRVLQVLTVVGLLVCIVGLAASAVVLSKHALWFLPAVPGASWARSVHMLCSHWAFLLAFAHAGLQFRTLLVRTGLLRGASGAAVWVMRALWLAVAAFGAWSFVQLGLAGYLFARVQFAAVDFTAPIALRIGQYASIAAMVVGLFHYLRALLASRQRSS